jgi:anti-sigma B factor antagonist
MELSHQALEPDLVIVSLKGRLDASGSPEVKSLLKDLIETGHLKIIVDLQEVPFIDSSGLAALVSGLRLARERKGTIALSGVQPQAYTVFRLTMLDRIFAIYPTLEIAQQSLA